MQNKWKNQLAFVLCLCIICISFFSYFYIGAEADHDCHEEHCSVCACIHSVKRTIKQLGLGKISSLTLIPFLSMILAVLLSMLPVLPCVTPVSQKIRMNH